VIPFTTLFALNQFIVQLQPPTCIIISGSDGFINPHVQFVCTLRVLCINLVLQIKLWRGQIWVLWWSWNSKLRDYLSPNCCLRNCIAVHAIWHISSSFLNHVSVLQFKNEEVLLACFGGIHNSLSHIHYFLWRDIQQKIVYLICSGPDLLRIKDISGV
jgi:hypothetical protein